ncbi:hypothetical protein L1887_19910 [Cichorium endivia]|nr:hypothetical protein L1887_19910 [Cichorium endivia]
MAILSETKPGGFRIKRRWILLMRIARQEDEDGICSSDRGRHVIKRDGRLRACPLVVLGLFVMPGQL